MLREGVGSDRGNRCFIGLGSERQWGGDGGELMERGTIRRVEFDLKG